MIHPWVKISLRKKQMLFLSTYPRDWLKAIFVIGDTVSAWLLTARQGGRSSNEDEGVLLSKVKKWFVAAVAEQLARFWTPHYLEEATEAIKAAFGSRKSLFT